MCINKNSHSLTPLPSSGPWTMEETWSFTNCFKGQFTRREGYPSKLVNPSWRTKDSPGLQAKFHRQGTLQPRTTYM